MADVTGPSPESDDMSEYLQTFLDETEEQLDDLVDTMLLLEKESTSSEHLNEAFRLIHSIKGSAGLMGLDQITVLTHHLENRFERFRSGVERLDDETMALVLRCIDFLKECGDRLRGGKPMGSPTELLEELKRLELQAANANPDAIDDAAAVSGGTHPVREPEDSQAVQSEHSGASVVEPSESVTEPSQSEEDSPEAVEDPHEAAVRIVVQFRDGLPLADLKAQLIANRLSAHGRIRSTSPDLASLAEDESIAVFQVVVETEQTHQALREAADVDGVESIEVAGHESEGNGNIESGENASETSEEYRANPEQDSESVPAAESLSDALQLIPDQADASECETETDSGRVAQAQAEPYAAESELPQDDLASPAADDVREPSTTGNDATGDDERIASEIPRPPETVPSSSEKGPSKVGETMRVDIDRLDNLMNLAGELVVNRARFELISSKISPARGKASALNGVRDFCDSIRRSLEGAEEADDDGADRNSLLKDLRDGLGAMDQYLATWENDRRQIEQYGEAIDQLTRVSQSLQKSVLDTRMVSVAPLFNRFKRVVRDLSKERGKSVHLEIRGEKTELDKRMIDELGDPLIHLVRNSLDHGLEPPDVRTSAGKSEMGTISLEATHSGNNVIIHVRDDGRGIDSDKIRKKLVNNQVLSHAAAAELSDRQALDYIWDPGFSTANEITDISGRGVGMDVVLTRIRRLNGSIEVQSFPGQGTEFSIRLPLTLAIINCLLVRMRGIVFSIPIDDVREIVSIRHHDVITVQGKRTFEIRGEFVSLATVDDIFQWNDLSTGEGESSVTESSTGKHESPDACTAAADAGEVDVVILRAGGKTMGLVVEELYGSQDMVIKSLSDNFIDIGGLAGASILGDGSVCLMLDVAVVFHMLTKSSTAVSSEGSIT